MFETRTLMFFIYNVLNEFFLLNKNELRMYMYDISTVYYNITLKSTKINRAFLHHRAYIVE